MMLKVFLNSSFSGVIHEQAYLWFVTLGICLIKYYLKQGGTEQKLYFIVA